MLHDIARFKDFDVIVVTKIQGDDQFKAYIQLKRVGAGIGNEAGEQFVPGKFSTTHLEARIMPCTKIFIFSWKYTISP